MNLVKVSGEIINLDYLIRANRTAKKLVLLLAVPGKTEPLGFGNNIMPYQMEIPSGSEADKLWAYLEGHCLAFE